VSGTDHAIFAAVADDDTGATDLAGMLADQGLRTVLLIDLPAPADYERWTAAHDAVIAGVGTRAIAPREAYERTRAAVRLLRAGRPAALAIKYCSTFDSTREGNIGPSIDAAMDETGERFTIALPALPVNGRTTYMGYHFVHRQLLSESPMRNHPLTPMTDSNLVRHLQAQTRRRVGLAAAPFVSGGPAALQREFARLEADGVAIAIVDCTSDRDLETIGEAIAGMPLITGSSAPAMKLPAVWRSRGVLPPAREPVEVRTGEGEGCGFLIVAGSCSEATRRQNSWAAANGAALHHLEAEALLWSADVRETVRSVVAGLRAGHTCLVTISSEPEGVRRVQDKAVAAGISAAEAGLKIAGRLAVVVRSILEQQLPRGLLVAGGETASAICRMLELGALEVGRNIEPGVPLCRSLGRFRLPVILKSGNFGSEDFYRRAQRRVV
jgi:3-dehydrotetronate 4-kinase